MRENKKIILITLIIGSLLCTLSDAKESLRDKWHQLNREIEKTKKEYYSKRKELKEIDRIEEIKLRLEELARTKIEALNNYRAKLASLNKEKKEVRNRYYIGKNEIRNMRIQARKNYLKSVAIIRKLPRKEYITKLKIAILEYRKTITSLNKALSELRNKFLRDLRNIRIARRQAKQEYLRSLRQIAKEERQLKRQLASLKKPKRREILEREVKKLEKELRKLFAQRVVLRKKNLKAALTGRDGYYGYTYDPTSGKIIPNWELPPWNRWKRGREFINDINKLKKIVEQEEEMRLKKILQK